MSSSRKNAEYAELNEMVDPFEKQGNKGKPKKKFRLPYTWIFWTIFLGLALWAVLDRFFINLFPMTLNFPPLQQTLGKVIVGPIPGTIILFDGFGRMTGRLILVTMNALFWTQCRTTENFIMEHAPRWIHLGDLRTNNNQIHYILGMWFMGVPVVVHMWLVFLPAIQGVAVTSTAGPRPASSVTPFIFFNNNVPNMFVSFDDIFRLALVTVLFCLVFPLSVSNLVRNKFFTLAQWLHIGAAGLYTVDFLRRSPHAQIFNSIVVFYWICDRVIGLFWYRTGQASIIHKEQLDEDYLVAFLYVPKQKRRRAIGSTYYLGFSGEDGLFDIAHPYIAFQNHTGEPLLPEWRNRDATSSQHKFYIERAPGERKAAFNRRGSGRMTQEQLDALEEERERQATGIAQDTDNTVFFSNWNTAVIVQIHNQNRNHSFTSDLANSPLGTRIRFWGPYTSEYGLITPAHMVGDLPPLVLIGTGAGCGPILDFYMYITANDYELKSQVTCYFSTNSVGLFQFFTDLTCAKSIPNWSVNAHLTGTEDYEADFEREDRARPESHSSTRDMKLGRLSFMEVLGEAPPHAEVFFCGAPALQWKVHVACAKYGLTYFPGHRFSAGGISNSCQRVGTVRFTCACVRFPFCLQY